MSEDAGAAPSGPTSAARKEDGATSAGTAANSNPRSEEFEEHRGHLLGVAYRMLGSHAEAEDAAQEAYLRFAATDRNAIRDPRGWLITTTGRICLDVLRSARVRREAYVGPWLPEPLVSRLPGDTPAPDAAAVRGEEIGMALLIVLESLTPEQRVAFVLHDVFAVPFDDIANTLGTTSAAARQLATRARRAVADGRPRHSASRAEQRRVVAAFLDAVQGGNMERLLNLLAPDVIVIGDGGGIVPAGRHPVHGALKAARLLTGVFRQTTERRVTAANPMLVHPVLVNGTEGFLVEYGPGPHRVVVGFAVDGGHITGVFYQLNPEKLTRVPAIDPTPDRPGAATGPL